jgi:hypothetical protein
VNVEHILLTVVHKHACQIASGLRQRLLQTTNQPDAFLPSEISALDADEGAVGQGK